MIILSLLLVLFVVLYTKRIYLALILGIVLQLLINNSMNPIAALFDFSYYSLGIVNNLYSILFIAICFIVGFIVYVLNKLHYNQAVAIWLDKCLAKVNSRKLLVVLMVVSSLFLFLETNFNAVSITQVWRNHCDRLKLPREKFAIYLQILSLSSVVIIPINIWGGLILVLMNLAGIDNVTQIIPLVYVFNIVSFVGIISILCIEIFNLNFVQLKSVENRTHEFGKLVRDKLISSKIQYYSSKIDYYLVVGMIVTVIGLIVLSISGFCVDLELLSNKLSSYQITDNDLFMLGLFYVLFFVGSVLLLYSFVIGRLRQEEDLLSGLSTTFNLIVMILLCIVFYVIFSDSFSYDMELPNNLLIILPLIVFVAISSVVYFSGLTWFSYFLAFLIIFSWFNLSITDDYYYIALLISAIINAGLMGNLLSKYSDTTQFAVILSECELSDIVRVRNTLYVSMLLVSCVFYLVMGFVV